MAMTYSALTGTKGATGSIKSWVNNSTIEADTILDDVQAYLNTRLRAREMLTTNTGTATTGQTSIPLPSDFRQGVKLEFTQPTYVIMVPTSIEVLEDNRFYSGTTGAIGTALPGIYAVLGTTAVFPTALDQNYTYRFVYYANMPTLGTATSTTWLTQKNPRLIRALCMAYAYDWLRNAPQQQYWMQVAEAEIDNVNAESSSELSGLDIGMSSG